MKIKMQNEIGRFGHPLELVFRLYRDCLVVTGNNKNKSCSNPVCRAGVMALSFLRA